jgi:DNA-binding NtrC family response regulator
MTQGALARRDWIGDGSPGGKASKTGQPRSVTGTGALKPLLLIADDEPSVLQVLQRLGGKLGYEVMACQNGTEAISAMRARPADLALVDLRMPDISGLEVLRQFRVDAPRCDVILMTAYAAVDSAVEAMKLGAREYMTKPFDFDQLRLLLADFRDEITRRADPPTVPGPVPDFYGMLGGSPVIHEVFGLIRKLAPHAKTVLISGETGTGKELAARAFHQSGSRRNKPFVTINCSAVVDTLFESELFGLEQGGGRDAKPGLFEAAQGGTVFLDEVGELPPAVQAKLLRTLENGEVLRVGALQPRIVDVGVVAATNRDLRADVTAGRFRADLYYRLNVVGIVLPPLRERREDIPLLAHAFMRECAARLQKMLTGLSEDAEAALVHARWDGNVRELRNRIERACMLAEGPLLTEKDVNDALSQHDAMPAAPRAGGLHVVRSGGPRTLLHDVEREHILSVLREVRGNRAAAAKVLGISRRALYRRLERHQIALESLRAVPAKRAETPSEP